MMVIYRDDLFQFQGFNNATTVCKNATCLNTDLSHEKQSACFIILIHLNEDIFPICTYSKSSYYFQMYVSLLQLMLSRGNRFYTGLMYHQLRRYSIVVLCWPCQNHASAANKQLKFSSQGNK